MEVVTLDIILVYVKLCLCWLQAAVLCLYQDYNAIISFLKFLSC